MTNRNHNPHLDGLRGLAILMVISYHYLTGFYIADFGWTGVDLFFVLSGYLLTGRLYPYLTDKKLLFKFYRNRFLRIVPLFWAFLIVFYIGWFGFASPDAINSIPLYKTAMAEFFAFLANWVFINNFSQPHIHFDHLWSLAAEEQFYIFFPFLILLIKNKRKLLYTGIILMIIILIARCAYFLQSDHMEITKIYWNSFFRADSFLAGFVLYMAKENGIGQRMMQWRHIIPVAALLMLIVGIIYQGSMRLNAFFVTFGFSLIAVIFAYLVFYAEAPGKNPVKTLTGSRMIRYFGKISYGLYLFHWPVYLLSFIFTEMVLRKLNAGMASYQIQLINGAVALLVTFIISALSFKYFESFFLKWKVKPSLKTNPQQVHLHSSP